MSEKTIEMNFGTPQQETAITMPSLSDQQLQFVIREFMKAFALKIGNVDAPSASFHPTNFFDQIYLQKTVAEVSILWVYVNGVWESTTFDF